ncbi:uncharacterized protein LOC122260223 isoform X2 [Penaeus japonicus]|uniref:uncharacterized protein LOC122260223 isoform X2 n=1 Tax=Penaeus japonicus TaxID=27405 RepID=UPI001C70EB35|nr:uncharacterized protein LOC122260223 isoform X2 [Penaeus japonicus]
MNRELPFPLTFAALSHWVSCNLGKSQTWHRRRSAIRGRSSECEEQRGSECACWIICGFSPSMTVGEGLKGLGSSGFLLSVARPSGGVVKVVVNDFDCVVDVKQELAREGGPEVPKQRLKAGGVEMHNEKRLRDYGITGEAVIWMESADDIEKKEREARIIKTIKNKKIRKRLVAVTFLIIFIIILIWAYANDKIKLNL